MAQSESPVYRDLTDWVVLCVLESVRRGDIRPSERLVEHEVATRFGVSRAPVRDALHKLETLGVVERRRPRGVYVRSWTDQDATEVLELMDALILLSVQLSVDKLSTDDLRELAEVVEESGPTVRVGHGGPRSPAGAGSSFPHDHGPEKRKPARREAHGDPGAAHAALCPRDIRGAGAWLRIPDPYRPAGGIAPSGQGGCSRQRPAACARVGGRFRAGGAAAGAG